MAFSDYKGKIAFAAADMDDADPVHADIARAAIANNALYACDSGGQVRIKWVASVAADCLAVDGTANNTFYRLYATFILASLYPGRGSFRFRVRFGGRSSQTDLCTFRLAIGHPDAITTGIADGNSHTWVAEYTSSSNTIAWLTEASSKTLLTADVDQVDSAIVNHATVLSAGGASTVVPICKLAVEVWAKSANISASIPQMAALVVEEYVGT